MENWVASIKQKALHDTANEFELAYKLLAGTSDGDAIPSRYIVPPMHVNGFDMSECALMYVKMAIFWGITSDAESSADFVVDEYVPEDKKEVVRQMLIDLFGDIYVNGASAKGS
jgi:hypothetical protein